MVSCKVNPPRGWYYRRLSSIHYLVIFQFFNLAHAQVLTPPYFNLAQGRRIVASSTCGEKVPEPELYCKLVGRDLEPQNKYEQLIQGQFCDRCDPNSEDKKHPAEFAVDGRDTRWQSPPLSRGMSYNQVNLTIDLGQEFHVAYVIVKMGNSPRPGVWALERSNDNGQTFQPWQYFADTPGECENFFGPHVDFKIVADDTVICTTEFSKIVPLEGGEIVVPLVQGRPSANDFFNSTVLQEWTRATNVRFRLLRVKNLLGHLMSIANQDTTTTRRYFYAIKDISIGGRCRCNGHADTCTSADKNDPYRLVCDCKDHTCGNNCETCCPGFEQKKWSQSKSNRRFVCEPCNCFGHTEQCVYDESIDNAKLSLDIHGNFDGGGVCQNCQHNTQGINCNKCVPGYFRPYGKNLNDTDVCKKCQCDSPFFTGNCEDGYGRCECKPEFTKPNCDSCSYGHYGFPKCQPCACFLNGTNSARCEPENGQCDCKFNFGGQFCKHCAEGYYNFSSCQPCECHPIGATSNFCDATSGECKCKNSFGSKNCDQCNDGYHTFPSCLYCNCDIKGTLPGICDKSNGQCLCKPGYGGARCDQCLAGYTGFPQCKPCNCSTVGSPFEACDLSGKCTCSPHFGGKQCDQCSPGFYLFPNCTACNCDPYGTQGLACREDGTCICKSNFEGEKCNECRKGYYNYPNCEKCTYNPAGVISNFTGCAAFEKPGDLKAITCKKNVQGRECSDCRELFWNLATWNPAGCEDCNCNLDGTIGEVATCNSHTGQCACKPSVQSRQCNQCVDGYYNLQIDNLFGCKACDCDIGGSMSAACNKTSGQCICLPRVDGRTCKHPSELHYFPTLHQHQFEIEDGRTSITDFVRYGYDANLFPGYSWKGYGIFSNLQNETIHEVFIGKSSIYRMILRYINLNNLAISGTVSVVSDSTTTLDEQKFQVLFKPTAVPSFVTVAGISGNNPSPFVMNPGLWIVKIKIEKNLFLDYFVLIPAEYYEASVLVSNITSACTIDDYNSVCRHYLYPNVSSYDYVGGTGAYLVNGDGSTSPLHYFNDYQLLGIRKIPVISTKQPELHLAMRVSRLGPHVFVLIYTTEKGQGRATITLEVTTPKTGNKGVIPINACRYTSLCRQVALDREKKFAVFDLDSNSIDLVLKGIGEGVGIDSIIAIPYEEWSLGYIQPKSACLMKDQICTATTYNTPPDSKRIDFKSDNEKFIAKNLPRTIFDNTTELVLLNEENTMVDLRGNVSKPGPYIFVVHYYQPDFPEFDADILIQDGIFYEGKIPVQHCPSNTGCRAVVKQANGNTQFQLPENFVFSVKKPNKKYMWLHYLLVVPSSQYSDQLLTELPYDETASFIAQCGQNHFYLNTSEEGFCRDATFSLTTKYNHGTLKCTCDYEGATSFKCETFGGQCPCKPNVIGRRCDSCRTGYFNFPNCQPCHCPSTTHCDPFTGDCICPRNVIGEKCNMCKQYTYGLDPIIGCPECQCNYYGVKNGNLQCDLQTGLCECKENIEGRTCDRCVAGHWQFPYCANCECDPRGTTTDVCNQTNADCLCKTHVHGQACDICNDGTFNLQGDNPEGCTKCFCFGKTSRCSSSNLFINSVTSVDNWKLATINITKSVEVTEAPTNVERITGGVEVNLGYVPDNMISYFVAPKPYTGNKLTSYGNHLNYTLHYTNAADGKSIGGHDVILYGANMYLLYESLEAPYKGTYFPVSMRIVESNFMTTSKISATREELMQVLQNLTAIYIKATYSDKSDITKISSVTLETASSEYNPNTNVALAVEQCRCPPNYVGLSCEECADGFYRVSTGPFGGYCVPCQCNKHAATCDKSTGVCINCEHNTKGDHCEKCETKYYGNATIGNPSDCLICACPLPLASNNFASECVINESGDRIICHCEQGYEGDFCERCAPGFYGRPDIQGDKCVPCQCNDNINPSEPGACDHVTGRCLKCLNNTYGASCEKCAPGYFGDAVVAKNCRPCDCDACGTRECDHVTGQCSCHENVIGAKCDRCADNHYGFTTCQGCAACNCQNASESFQCDDLTGHCRCKPGVTGQLCERCSPGYWLYSPEGCTSCGCKTEYSIGVGCNPLTGMCECLPGVVGDKCNQCPHRWVLIPGEGCIGCDKCTDGLLDVTDMMHAEFLPIFNQFQSASIAYFTVQRLKFINHTADKYALNVSDILSHQFDLTPYSFQITIVGSEAENAGRNVQSLHEMALYAAKEGSLTHEMATDLEILVGKVISNAKMTVFHMNTLTYDLQTGSVSQVDYTMDEARDLLEKIEKLKPNEDQEMVIAQALDKAKNVSALVTDFAQPLINMTATFTKVKEKHETFEKKLDEVDDVIDRARRNATNAIAINQVDKYKKFLDRLDSLRAIIENVETVLANLPGLTTNTTAMLNESKELLKSLIVSKETLVERHKKTEENLNPLRNEFQKASEDARKAAEHAEKISNQANDLEKIARNQVTGNQAVKAAESYSSIVTLVEGALENLTTAKADVDLATQMIDLGSLIQRIDSTRASAIDARGSAMEVLTDTQGDFSTELKNLQDQQHALYTKLNQTRERFESILNELKRMRDHEGNKPSEQLDMSNIEELTRRSLELSANTKDIFINAPLKLEEAKNLFRDRSIKKVAVHDAGSYTDQLNVMIPQMLLKVDKLADTPKELNDSLDTASAFLNTLKSEISFARDTVSKIKIGVTLSPRTSLELPLPPSLLDQGSSTDLSLYFNASKPNALLFYIGNNATTTRQKRDTLRKPKLDDFLALLLVNGYPQVKVHLGGDEQPTTLVSSIPITLNEWHRARIERTGKILNFTVTNHRGVSASRTDVASGFNSILNFDKDYSKFYIGGLPDGYNPSGALEQTTFSGQIEDMTVNGEQVGLWNFVSIVMPEGLSTTEAVTGAVERNRLRMNLNSTICRLNGVDSYLKLPASTHSDSTDTNIIMRFKTTAQDGSLFLIFKGQHFIVLEMRSGFIYFRFNLGKGLKQLHSSDAYNDDEWHEVTAIRVGNQGTLRVDGKIVAHEESDDKVEFELPEYLYVGGFETTLKIPDVVTTPFEGCLDSIQLQSISVNMRDSVYAHKITPGCQNKFSNFVSFEEGHLGFVRWPRPRLNLMWKTSYNFELTLRFKTKIKSALMAYCTDNNRSYSLHISDGILIFKHKNREVRSSPNVKYNDDHWHAILVALVNDRLHLIVDDFDVSTSPQSISDPVRFGDAGRVYFGTVPADVDSIAAVENPFGGCIGDVTFNGIVVNFENVAEGRSAVIGHCSGREKDIILQGETRPSFNETSVTPPAPPVTEAPGSLPREPGVDPELNDESGWRFGTSKNSVQFHQFDPSQIGSEFALSLEMKTVKADGVLFYVSNRPESNDFISLYMKESNVRLKYKCGATSGMLTHPVINQGEWHTAKISITTSGASLLLNNNDPQKSNYGCDSFTLKSPYHIGGIYDGAVSLEKIKDDIEGVNRSFVGCLKNFRPIGQLMEPQRVNVIPCSSKVEEGTFFPASGYVRLYETFTVGSNLNIALRIKARTMSGLIMAVHSYKDFLVLQMVNGSLKLTVENSHGPVSATFQPDNPYYFLDNKFHKIYVTKRRNIIFLTVDTQKHVTGWDKDGRREYNTDTSNPLYVGGYPPTLAASKGIETSAHFIGCIKDLELNGTVQELSSGTAFGGVMFNVCPTI